MGRAGVEAGRGKAREIGVWRDQERNRDGEETGMEPRMSLSLFNRTGASFG